MYEKYLTFFSYIEVFLFTKQDKRILFHTIPKIRKNISITKAQLHAIKENAQFLALQKSITCSPHFRSFLLSYFSIR